MAATSLPRDERSTRPGPWGTSRTSERRWGYPSPVRSEHDDILDRLTELEDAIARMRAREDAEYLEAAMAEAERAEASPLDRWGIGR